MLSILNRIGNATRIAFGLSLLAVAVVCGGQAVGLIPSVRSIELGERRRTAELLATQLSGAIGSKDGQLARDVAELADPRIAVHDQGNLIQAWAQRRIEGVPVRDVGVTAIVNHGNLVLLGLDHWGDADAAAARIGADEARSVVAQHAQPFLVEAFPKDAHLEYIATASGDAYAFRLTWVVRASVQLVCVALTVDRVRAADAPHAGRLCAPPELRRCVDGRPWLRSEPDGRAVLHARHEGVAAAARDDYSRNRRLVENHAQRR
mgnify:CR=1 FL=1